MENAFPGGVGSNLGLVLANFLHVKLTSAGVDIDVVKLQPTLTLPKVADSPEESDDEDSEVGVEEALGVSETRLSDGRGDSSVELYQQLVKAC